MKPHARPRAREAPHPLVTLVGVLIAFALIWITLETALLARSTAVIITIGFVIVFPVGEPRVRQGNAREARTRTGKDPKRPGARPGRLTLYSSCLWKRSTLSHRIVTPRTARAAICGQRVLIPVPCRKIPRTISMK